MASPPTPPVNPVVMVLMLILWATVTTIFVILLIKNKLSRMWRTTLWITSIVLGGILLGGVPNAVFPISQLFLAVGAGTFIIVILQQIIILAVLIVSALFLGRTFCGVACPLGAAQELVSSWQFRSTIAGQKKARFGVDISPRIAPIIRWIFFGSFALLAFAWSISLVDLLNPFTGFKVFANPWLPTFLIPVIALLLILSTSVFIYRPWCRLFCPFGALTSLAAKYSRAKLWRTEQCTDCQLCEKICPTHEAAREASKGECYLCNRCVEICPQHALKFGVKKPV